MGPRNSTWFTGPFSGHETKARTNVSHGFYKHLKLFTEQRREASVPGLWPIESCHTFWGLMPRSVTGTVRSSSLWTRQPSRSHGHRCSLILPQDRDLNYVMLSVCVFVCYIWDSGVDLFSCCCILHAHLGQSDNNLWTVRLAACSGSPHNALHFISSYIVG